MGSDFGEEQRGDARDLARISSIPATREKERETAGVAAVKIEERGEGARACVKGGDNKHSWRQCV